MTFIYLLLLASCVLVACVLLHKATHKIGIPYLLAFIVLGMIFGTDGLFGIHLDNFVAVQRLCATALVFIMFYGGFDTNWQKTKKVVVVSTVLASVGVVLTAALTAIFCHFVLQLPWIESFLMGSVISSTDAASVFAILKSKKLNLKFNSTLILEMESGSNDPAAYLLTTIFIKLFTHSIGLWSLIGLVAGQIVIGLVAGLLIAWLGKKCLDILNFANDGFNFLFVAALALLAYALPEALGGNGYLATYVTGMYIGQQSFAYKKDMVHFFNGVTTLCQIAIFFLLGLLSFPSQFGQVALPAIAIFLFLLVVARPLTLWIVARVIPMTNKQIVTLSWAGLRGVASIVFAIMVVTDTDTQTDIFHMVFFVVLLSILLQGAGLPFVSKKCDMIDHTVRSQDSFTSFTEDRPIDCIRVTVPEHHPWHNCALKDIQMPPHALVGMIYRNNQSLLPHGKTVIQAGDDLVLVIASRDITFDWRVTQHTVKKGGRFINKQLQDVAKDNELIIAIERDNDVLIPNGSVTIQEHDKLIINTSPIKRTDTAQTQKN